MNSLLRTMLVLTLCVFGVCGIAECGVKGKQFTGSYTYNSGTEVDVVYDFRSDNSFTVDEGNSFDGTYTELEFSVFSIWFGNAVDGSPDGKSFNYGVSLFSLVTTVGFNNSDTGVTGSGVAFSSGPATLQAPSSTPGAAQGE